MPQTVMPNAKYRSRLRQVLRLLDREKVVEACNLLEKLKADAEQFRIFTRSSAFGPFCKAVSCNERFFRVSIKAYEAKLIVLGYIQADLRPETRPKAKVSKRRALGAHAEATRGHPSPRLSR